MPSPLTIIAGKSARKHLLNYGFRQRDFSTIVAASGGPKWFILFGLDKYLFGEFFKNRNTPVHTLGSSAGAWQLSCFSQRDPVSAISTLAKLYSSETYSAKPTAEEVTRKAEILLNALFGDHGIADMANHPIVKTHILADRSRGLVTSESRPVQMLGLAIAAISNALSRKLLRYSFERVIFHSDSSSYFEFPDQPTRYVALTPENGKKALMATGSIPLVLKGVTNIKGAPQGIYRDGGIIDYHFDLPFTREGLVLYPHFSQRVVPGWFDKKLPYRKANPKHYDNVVILTPSENLIASLPYGKISDRTDFLNFDVATRQKYWQTVLGEGERLADAFHQMVENGVPAELIRTFPGT